MQGTKKCADSVWGWEMLSRLLLEGNKPQTAVEAAQKGLEAAGRREKEMGASLEGCGHEAFSRAQKQQLNSAIRTEPNSVTGTVTDTYAVAFTIKVTMTSAHRRGDTTNEHDREVTVRSFSLVFSAAMRLQVIIAKAYHLLNKKEEAAAIYKKLHSSYPESIDILQVNCYGVLNYS